MTSSFILFYAFEIEANKSCCVPVHVVITRVENKHSLKFENSEKHVSIESSPIEKRI